jgi:hypothetical protein
MANINTKLECPKCKGVMVSIMGHKPAMCVECWEKEKGIKKS